MSADNKQNTTTEKFKKEFNKELDSLVLPARFAKDYHIIDCIKETADRSVYIIADKDENRFILKTGRDKRAEALWQEFHLNEQLIKIPELAIPESINCIETEDGCFLMNTYIKGLNLMQYQEKYAPLSEPDVVSLMFKMCQIVKLLHSQDPPVIHRDIKPENFVLEEGTGILYLVDLDTGRQFLPKKKRDTMFVGTFSQAAPEQFGFSQSDVRTDIYGLGKSMVYLLTGDASAENIKEYGISQDFHRIVVKSTEFDPQKRYADVKEMIHDLKRYQMRHVTLRSYRPAVVCSLVFLALGLGLGYAAGAYLTDRTLADGQTPEITDTRLAKATADESADANTDNADFAGGHLSLREQAGVSEFKPDAYAEYYDAIILDYYANDGEALVKDCEAFVSALQEDKEINRILEEDYSKLDEDAFPGFWDRDGLSTVRVRIAYKDRILYRNLGHYDEYEFYLLSSFGNYLNNTSNDNFLIHYAMGNRFNNADDFTQYAFTMSDCLCCITDAFNLKEQSGK